MPTILEQLVKEYSEAKFKHTTPTGTPSTPYYTGPGGLYGVTGLERELISTRIEPRGLASVLPARGSMTASPLFPYFTGFLDSSGDVADGVCDDGPTAGPGKSCIQTAQFGRYTYMTRELELDRVALRINRGEFQDMVLMNTPMVDAGSALITPSTVNTDPSLANEVLMRFLEVGIQFQNTLIPHLYVANPANNSAGGGYKEFPGLDILISVNKFDALTGAECNSLDSDIKDFNYGRVDNLPTDDIVNVITYMMRYLKHNASGMKLNPATWNIVMREDLFYEITAIWPCSYLTYRCAFRAVDGTQVLNVDAAAQVQFRDAMRNGSYLTIDGTNYPVVIDDGIVEETAGDNANINEGSFASDIYIVPRTFRGNNVATFWEYLDYNRGAMPAATAGRYDEFWTDGGMYLWHKKPAVNWCVQWIAKIEPRVILRVPQLAGRITNVQYSPLQHVRQPFPDDPYHLDGGVSVPRSETSLYSDWNQPQ